VVTAFPHLVDPTAPAMTAMTERRHWGGSGRLALVDAMLNPASGWGAGILDAVEDAIRALRSDVVVDRVRREHRADAVDSDAWAAAMAAMYRALVIAGGD
jgi:hypothetical protein